jgi:hypothetical protein
VLKLLLEHGADATIATADRQTPIHAVLAGRAVEPQALELIRVLQKAGADVNVIALVNHREEIRGGTALHYAVRKRYKTVIKEARLVRHRHERLSIRDGLTALDYTQSRGFHAVHGAADAALQGRGALLRELGATKADVRRVPCGRVLGPPQESGRHLAARRINRGS